MLRRDYGTDKANCHMKIVNVCGKGNADNNVTFTTSTQLVTASQLIQDCTGNVYKIS